MVKNLIFFSSFLATLFQQIFCEGQFVFLDLFNAINILVCCPYIHQISTLAELSKKAQRYQCFKLSFIDRCMFSLFDYIYKSISTYRLQPRGYYITEAAKSSNAQIHDTITASVMAMTISFNDPL